MYFQKNSTTVLTKDTDENRINSDMCAIVTPDGRRVIFYAKTFTSGRLSNGRVTYSLPFTINVEAGNGQINGIPVIWSSASFSVDPSTFTLIYVTDAGVVGKTIDFPAEFIKNVIVLAYVSSGGSEIVYVEEVEKVSKNIYVKRQATATYGWVWDDYEFILNTGEQPRAFYDVATAKVYMSYKKDGVALCRLFDVSSESTWSYIPNTRVISSIKYLSRNQESSLYFSAGVGSKGDADVNSVDLFPLSTPSALCFIYTGGSFKAFIFLPFITGGFLSYINYPYYVDIYTFDGLNYTLENTVTFNDNSLYLLDARWYQCPTDNQDRYIGVRVNSNLMVGGYETLPENRVKIDVFPAFYEVIVVGNNISVNAIEERLPFSGSQGSKSEVVKVIEFLETRDTETDNCDFKGSSGSKADMVKIIEYFEARDFETDNCEFSGALGSRCELIIS